MHAIGEQNDKHLPVWINQMDVPVKPYDQRRATRVLTATAMRRRYPTQSSGTLSADV